MKQSTRFCSLFLVGLFGMIALLSSCRKERISTDASDQLAFSVDTLSFDTVFTTRGSTTKLLKVFNPNDQAVIIDKIELTGGAISQFRINVDGISTPIANDIELAAEDSLYIFVEVTVDPDAPVSASPFVILETIEFETNGNMQEVVLSAYGQNAYYYGTKSELALLTCNGGTFSFPTDKPNVIYGILFIDSCLVDIMAGTDIYVHGGLVFNQSLEIFYNDGLIYILPDATLQINGTQSQPVTIQGDRLEDFYQTIPGQWTGILLDKTSSGHTINYAEIRNSSVGLRVDSAVDLTINNSIIHNTQNSGLLAVHADVTANNCLFYSSNVGNAVQLEFGGNYQFNHCTITGYGVEDIQHKSPSLRMTNVSCLDEFCGNFLGNDLNATFNNCIITGSRADEISLFNKDGAGAFNYTFDHCMVRVSELTEPDNYPDFLTNCNNCQVNTEPYFADVDEQDYHLDSLISSAINTGNPSLAFPTIDLDGVSRISDIAPDLGCYEYVP